MKRIWHLSLLVLLIIAPINAVAHQVFLSSVRIAENPNRQIDIELKVEGSDLEKVFKIPLTIRGGIVNPHILDKHKKKLTNYLIPKFALSNLEGDSCHLISKETKSFYQGVALTTKWDCRKVEGELFYQTSLFFDLAPNAGQLVFIKGMKNKTPPLLNSKTPKISITGPPPTFLETTTRFVASGIEHIFLGYDHIAFLIALLLWTRRLISVVKLVTAFTVAHTITLSLATLDIITLPTLFVEAAIAATIIYVAAENFFRRDADQRWPLTFFLGLVHGFGFASVLKEFGLPENAVVTALAMFNVGVEIGQIAIVGICLPIILVVDQLIVGNAANAPNSRRNPIFVHILSGVILLLGIYWFVTRVFLSGS
jgi:hydrogenase/urease accessory protein HupE